MVNGESASHVTSERRHTPGCATRHVSRRLPSCLSRRIEPGTGRLQRRDDANDYGYYTEVVVKFIRITCTAQINRRESDNDNGKQ